METVYKEREREGLADPGPSGATTSSSAKDSFFSLELNLPTPTAEERMLTFFEKRLAEMTPEDAEKAVTAAQAVEVRDKGQQK